MADYSLLRSGLGGSAPEFTTANRGFRLG